MSKGGSNHSNCGDGGRLCRHGAFELGLEEEKRFWKGRLKSKKMGACLENLEYSSCLKLTVTRSVLGKEFRTIN